MNKHRNQSRRVLQTIVGMVDPEHWDSSGRVSQVAISTEDDRVTLSPRGQGAELLDMLNAQVAVTGFVTERDGDPYMVVRRFECVDDCDDLRQDVDDDRDYGRWAIMSDFGPRALR